MEENTTPWRLRDELDARYNVAGTDIRIDPACLQLHLEILGCLSGAPLRATLSKLSDTELMDIGTTRGEIDYVAAHRGIDPRGIRSSDWLRYLPTVDGQRGAHRLPLVPTFRSSYTIAATAYTNFGKPWALANL